MIKCFNIFIGAICGKKETKPKIIEEEILIKSRDRVKNLAEVYTAEREVNNMLDLLPKNPIFNILLVLNQYLCRI